MPIHSIKPVFDAHSEILILGSFPSVRSREQGFFYGHPQNRFWCVLAGVLGVEVPQTVEEKKRLLLDHCIALWDVIASCEITGSSDQSIQQVEVNDLDLILSAAPIAQIYVNGKTAEKYYRRYLEPVIGRAAICLPSTSPANAAWSREQLIEAWSVIKRGSTCRSAR